MTVSRQLRYFTACLSETVCQLLIFFHMHYVHAHVTVSVTKYCCFLGNLCLQLPTEEDPHQSEAEVEGDGDDEVEKDQAGRHVSSTIYYLSGLQ